MEAVDEARLDLSGGLVPILHLHDRSLTWHMSPPRSLLDICLWESAGRVTAGYCALSRWNHKFYSLSEHFWGQRTQTQLISASLGKRREFEFLTTDDIPVFLRRSCAFIVWIAEASVWERKTQAYIEIRFSSLRVDICLHRVTTF